MDGRTLTRPLTVAMDPRVKVPAADLAAQHAAARRLAADLARLDAARKAGADAEKADALERKLARLYALVQESDDAPTPQLLAAADAVEKQLEDLVRGKGTGSRQE